MGLVVETTGDVGVTRLSRSDLQLLPHSRRRWRPAGGGRRGAPGPERRHRPGHGPPRPRSPGVGRHRRHPRAQRSRGRGPDPVEPDRRHGAPPRAHPPLPGGGDTSDAAPGGDRQDLADGLRPTLRPPGVDRRRPGRPGRRVRNVGRDALAGAACRRVPGRGRHLARCPGVGGARHPRAHRRQHGVLACEDAHLAVGRRRAVGGGPGLGHARDRRRCRRCRHRGRLRGLDVAHLFPGHGRPVHGEAVTAGALGPGEGPEGMAAFFAAMARCLAGRVPPRSVEQV